jgi:hypothetical protein
VVFRFGFDNRPLRCMSQNHPPTKSCLSTMERFPACPSSIRLGGAHPDWEMSWHCPILNPLGPSKTASLSLEGSSLMDTVVGRTPVKAVDVNTDDSDTDTDDTGTTAGSSVVSLISKDGVSVETTLRAKVTDKGEPHYDDVPGTTTASTVEISVARNAVKRVVSVE